LSNGVKIPCVGFGTWQTKSGDEAENSVKWALESGYRHIDTAWIYGNEESVGKAIKDSGIPRDQYFVTTKIFNRHRGYKDTIEMFETSLKNLGLFYVDLYLIHWPNPLHFRNAFPRILSGTWRAMEDIYKEGRARAIGVSNFCVRHLDALFEYAEIKPHVNQIRLGPGDTKDDVVYYSRKNGLLLEAYSPLGTGELLKSPELKEIADKYNKSVAQLCIRWSIQMGFLPLPKSVTKERIEENTNVFDFEISQDDVRAMWLLKGNADTWHPDFVPW
jgi:diketogulonate reductase-like aldo/keto reductase